MRSVILLLFLLTATAGLGQSVQPLRIDSLPPQGFLLDNGWTFHAGDNPEWAKAEFDDSKWERIDPTTGFDLLPQIRKSSVGWLRIHLRVSSTLVNKALAFQVKQNAASEIFLNGNRLKTYGIVSNRSGDVTAFNPADEPEGVLFNQPNQVVAIRFSIQEGFPPYAYTRSYQFFRMRIRDVNHADRLGENTILLYYLHLIYLGFFLVLGLIHLSFYLILLNKRANLYFSLFALSTSIGEFIYMYLITSHSVAINVYAGKILNAFYPSLFSLFLLLAVYALFPRKKGLYFWLLIIYLFGIYFLSIFIPLSDLARSVMPFFLISIFSLQIVISAYIEGKRSAGLLVFGMGGQIIFYFIYILLLYKLLPNPSIGYDFRLWDVFWHASRICISLLFSFYLAKEFAETSIDLEKRLDEVHQLSEEKQQILATQNETLEKQVAERTAELEHKNQDLEIEAALDKIRSRSLAMHSSDELQEVVIVVFQKLKELGLVFDGGAGIQLFTEGSKDSILWVSAPNQIDFPIRNNLPYDADDFMDNPIILDVWKAKETGESIYNKIYTRDEKNKYFDYVFKHNDLVQIPQFLRDEIMQASGYTQAFVVEKNSGVVANSWTGEVFPPDKFDIFKRIAKVFDQAYIRFLDLQKAEAQTREAQIEVALERVRSRTMAMQESNELTEVAELLFKQVKSLGIKTWTTGFNVWSDDNNFYTDYITNPQGGFMEPYTIDTNILPVSIELSKAKRRGDEIFVNYEEGEQLAEVYRQLSKFGEKQFKGILESGFEFPTSQYEYFVFGSEVSLMFITYESVPEVHEIFKRFGKVFDQTYTRFLDLKKAEAQAEQAQLDLIRIQTEKKRAEDALAQLQITQIQLIQKEKLASLGELTAGIAHEIQNPLNFVNNFSEVSTELVDELREEIKADHKDDALAIADDLNQNLQ
ncbi:MAG: hypothetical protein JWP57_4258, partial [Spirosoma sp.]|nr:hypothetical protein [Spirosoma sp.]